MLTYVDVCSRILTYATFNEALRIYKHDVYLHDVKVCEGRQDLHMHTSAYVGIRGARAPPFGHASAACGPKKKNCFLAPFRPFPPFLSCLRPVSPLVGLFLPLSRALRLAQHALRARARARRKKKNGVGGLRRHLARHLQKYTPAFAGFRTLYTHNVHSQKAA
jgi:hypothetical protein